MTEYERINRQFEKLFFGRVNKAIRKKIDAVISIIQSSGIESAISSLNNKLTNPDLVKEVERLYTTVGLRHANRSMRDLKRQKGIFDSTWVRFIIDYLRVHFIEKITFNVDRTTRDYLLRVLRQSIAEGWGVDKTVSNLNESNFSEFQAARIVRTEVNTASNAGVLAAGDTYEYQMLKEWVAHKDSRTRGTDIDDHASHVALNGTVIDFEDVFVDSRNGDRLSAPGDPSASAASIINCRCNLVLKPKRDARGRLIPKNTAVVIPITR
jgi:hypothetical protein